MRVQLTEPDKVTVALSLQQICIKFQSPSATLPLFTRSGDTFLFLNTKLFRRQRTSEKKFGGHEHIREKRCRS